MTLLARTRGFTLIELLVVIAIIAMLASIILSSLNTARSKSRDARREADLKEMQTAVEQYMSDSNGVPPTSLATLVPKYMPALPLDPYANTTNSYGYAADTTTGHYCIGTKLENAAPSSAATTCGAVTNSVLTSGVSGSGNGTNPYYVGA